MSKGVQGRSLDDDDLGSSTAQAAPPRRPVNRIADDTAGTQMPRQQAPAMRGADESQYVAAEVAGDATSYHAPAGEAGAEAGAHEEVGFDGAGEAAEEFAEASAEQLAAESGEESAEADLEGVEGYEAAEAGEEGGAEALAEAGEGMEGGPREEFLPMLAALVPTLVSAVGPAVAKGVMGRLSPRARRLVKKVAKPAVGAAVQAAGRRRAGGVVGMIAKLLEAGEQAPAQGGGESGAEVDEAFLAEAAAVLEVIIGTDDRVRVTKTTAVPWRRICALRIQFPSGATYRGSGFLIGPRAVATAGHCVYLHAQGGWAKKVTVIPGCNGAAKPFGQAESSVLRSVGGWVQGKKPESDYGCVVLPPGAFSQNLGSFGFAAFPPAALLAQPAVVAGYPGDKPFAELWGMKRKIKTVTAKTLIYDIDTVGGQSGCPVYIKRNGQRYVVGIHNYGAATGNSATRVTQPVYQRLLAWSKIT